VVKGLEGRGCAALRQLIGTGVATLLCESALIAHQCESALNAVLRLVLQPDAPVEGPWHTVSQAGSVVRLLRSVMYASDGDVGRARGAPRD
jgi:hypothetical protein